jgi:hypothetical protein
LSPLPPIEDELEICLEAFCKAKGIPSDIITSALTVFHEVSYNPDAICEATLEQLQEVNSLAERQALMLKRFVHGWCGKIDAKRAKW